MNVAEKHDQIRGFIWDKGQVSSSNDSWTTL